MRTTGLFVVGVLTSSILVMGAYDLCAQLGIFQAATLSAWFSRMGYAYPIIPCLFSLSVGLALGHFWWPVSQRE